MWPLVWLFSLSLSFSSLFPTSPQVTVCSQGVWVRDVVTNIKVTCSDKPEELWTVLSVGKAQVFGPGYSQVSWPVTLNEELLVEQYRLNEFFSFFFWTMHWEIEPNEKFKTEDYFIISFEKLELWLNINPITVHNGILF